MIQRVNKDIVSFLLKAGLPLKSAVKEDIHKNESHLETSRPDIMTNPSQSNQQALNEAEQKVKILLEKNNKNSLETFESNNSD